MSLSVTQFPVGGFDENFAYLIHTETSAYIVDPSGDTAQLYTYISTNSLTVTGVILTHSHHDHFDALSEVMERFPNIPIYVHERGLDLVGDYETLTPMHDRDELTLGERVIQVLYTPGHSDDSVCLFIPAEYAKEEAAQLISGDTLFVGGCGRTSAHRVHDLYESLQQLRELPGDTIVYPGHDYGSTPTSTIERELVENRFYQCTNFDQFKALRLG